MRPPDVLAPARLGPAGIRMIKAASPGDLQRITRAAGFDAVEIHLGHNYLISSFLSPRLNRRSDEFGGSLASRARLARDVAREVREAVGGRLVIIAKLNMDDGVPGGLCVYESIQVARWLEADGRNLMALRSTRF